LAAEKTYNNLGISVTEALEYRRNRFDGVASCSKTETMGAIMERIVKKEVHRLVVVDGENRVQGVVSLSDILTYIVLKQSEKFSEQLESKTANLTTAFGKTRLSSSDVQPENILGGEHVPSNIHDSDHIAAVLSPLAAQLSQPLGSADNAIFEDDPMES
jgi:5'-AMP-activated protein kinase regulatory gamma subunit